MTIPQELLDFDAQIFNTLDFSLFFTQINNLSLTGKFKQYLSADDIPGLPSIGGMNIKIDEYDPGNGAVPGYLICLYKQIDGDMWRKVVSKVNGDSFESQDWQIVD